MSADIKICKKHNCEMSSRIKNKNGEPIIKKNGKYSYQIFCHQCKKENYFKTEADKIKQYRKENLDIVRAKDRDKYSKNKNLILERRKSYYEKNKDKISAKNKTKYQENKDKILLYQEQYRKDNREELKIKHKKAYYDRKENGTLCGKCNEIYFTHCKKCNKEIQQKYNDKLKYCKVHNIEYQKHKCPECSCEMSIDYYYNHIDDKREYNKEYYQNNSNKIIDKSVEYARNRRKIDIVYKLRRDVSKDILRALKANNGSKMGQSILEYLENSFQQMKDHIESTWLPGMSWENHGTYRKDKWNDRDPTTWTWQIDHIIPQSDLPYASMEDENFKKCWALNNLRALWSKQNLLDGANRVRHLNKKGK